MRIAMVGATGLIGRSVAPALVRAGHELMILGRRASGVAGAREIVANMDEWPRCLAGEAVDIAISTLGTTWAQSRSWAAFAAVDRDAVLGFANAARAAGARQMISVSSIGANPASANRYLALKGEVDERLAAVGFERLDVVRPALLRGPRGRDRRFGERLGIAVSPLTNRLLVGGLARFRAIDATRVADAIVALVGANDEGAFVQNNREIDGLARRRDAALSAPAR